MPKIPFGVAHLDRVIGGGAPDGSVVLLVGESGAGAREFLYTSAAMNALATGDPELFDLYYGDLHGDAAPPPEVHFVSFTEARSAITSEMGHAMDEDIVAGAVDEITFTDLSRPYFQTSPVPRDWYAGTTHRVTDLERSTTPESVLEAFGRHLSEKAPGNLVVVDSVTDLVDSIAEGMTWTDIAMLVKGLVKAVHRWGGLVILLANRATLEPTELGHLTDGASGTLVFEWESGGSKRARTMVVEEFRGVLSRLEDENIVRFETEIHEGGFDISDVRKIR